jgi:hypothetical protein
MIAPAKPAHDTEPWWCRGSGDGDAGEHAGGTAMSFETSLSAIAANDVYANDSTTAPHVRLPIHGAMVNRTGAGKSVSARSSSTRQHASKPARHAKYHAHNKHKTSTQLAT